MKGPLLVCLWKGKASIRAPGFGRNPLVLACGSRCVVCVNCAVLGSDLLPRVMRHKVIQCGVVRLALVVSCDQDSTFGAIRCVSCCYGLQFVAG